MDKIHLLVVEDDIWMARLIGHRLRSENYAVEFVATGRKALTWIRRHPESIILIDYLLPDLTAAEVIRRTQEARITADFVIMTSLEEIGIALETMRLGIHDFILKNKDFAINLPRVLDKVRQKLRIQAELAASTEQLRKLSSQLQLSQEQERRRIALEIHDELGQSLTAIKLDLCWLRDQAPTALWPTINGTIELTDQTIETVRRLSTELRPRILDHLGFIAAIEWYLTDFQKRTRIDCTLKVTVDEFEPPEDQAIALFRIVQEALTNVVRHAQASRVSVAVRRKERSLELSITDNGAGIAAGRIAKLNSLGIIGMQERLRPWGGKVVIDSPVAGGTRVRALLPLTAPAEPAGEHRQ
ncbi:MAG: ATP-binding protein [Candidatus Neomarinimicrobiota bacterium]